MFLCVCNAIREKDFRTLAAVCTDDAETIYRELGHQPQCRQCLEEADDILSELRCCCAA